MKTKMGKLLAGVCISFMGFTGVFANVEDNSIQQELDTNNTQELQHDFDLQTFDSCQNMEEIMGEYVKEYWKTNYSNGVYRKYSRGFIEPELSFESVGDDLLDDSDSIEESITIQKSVNSEGASSDDFSETNTQVAGVDESDIVKTDGKYVYYHNAEAKAVFIIDVQDKSDLKILKKINIPKNMYNPVLYIDDNRLVIVANGYSYTNYKTRYWYNR
ncbi:MAG: hypothetical protein GY828_06135, partial [Candidatus Gracilibacteria bacterium]|nr:hypothetical protein [Candidatus Gracilibacteria bacterium]